MKRPGTRRPATARPTLEALEYRLVLSWAAVPPASVPPPLAPTAVTLDRLGDAGGDAWINSEVDFYRFVAPASGAYRFSTSTPTGPLNTVLGVYNAAGQRLAYNNDAAPGNTDSDATATLTAGQKYCLAVTNLVGTPGGGYKWKIDGPASDDSYEENDSRQTARDLGTLTSRFTAANLVMADAADWYRFTMAGPGTASDLVRIAFQHARGDLDLRVYNASGVQVGESLGGGDSEQVSLAGLAAGTYYVKVYGWQSFNPNYSLEIAPGRIAADDRYEENDTLATASDLGMLTGRFLATDLVKGDVVDWYRFTMPGIGAKGDLVRISFKNAEGNLDLRLYDPLGRQLAASLTTNDTEQVSLEGLPGGTYCVQVYGWSARNPNYSLEIVPGRSDDAYEDNDTFVTARDLGTLASRFTAGNLVMGDAADWYKFTMADSLLGGSDFVQIAFRHDYGDLELRLYDSSGALLRQSQTNRDVERVPLGRLTPGVYYVKVSGVSSALNPNYSLEIQPPPADDSYEDNDTRGTAADLGALETRTFYSYNLKLTDSADWFRFTVPPRTGESFVVSARHEGTGTIRLDLYTADGTLVSGGTLSPQYVNVVLTPHWPAGTYFVKVSEIDGKPIFNYTLSILGEVLPDDDRFEDNDTMSQAAAGSAAGEGGEDGKWSPSYNLVLMDVDWFRITINPNQQLPGQPKPRSVIYVDAQNYQHIGFDLYDGQGRLIYSGNGWGGWFEFTGLQGDYYLKFTPLVAYTRYSFGVNSNIYDDAL
jgi:hypothetical protein